MKRIFTISFLCLSLLFLFSGCSLKLNNVESLMRPPKLSGASAGVQEAFEKATADKKVRMKTPTAGDKRSSYVLFDIDGDGEEEAITFYSNENDETTVFMHVLDYQNGTWQSVADIRGKGSEVYKIDFCDMNADGVSEIVVCWSLFESHGNKVLTVYAPHVTEYVQSVQELVSEPFTQTIETDMDDDGADDIFITTILSDQSKPRTIGKLLSMDENFGIYTKGVVELSPSVGIKSLQSQKAEFSQKRPAYIFADLLINENTMITDIVYWDETDGILKAPLFTENAQENPATARSSQLPTVDIDGDGILEIPITEQINGFVTIADEESLPLLLTTFLQFSKDELREYRSGLMIYQSSYMFEFSKGDSGRFVVEYDMQTRTCTFYKRTSSGKKGTLLFSLYTIPKTEWEENHTRDQAVLNENHSLLYVYSITKNGEKEGIDKDSLENRFSVLT